MKRTRTTRASRATISRNVLTMTASSSRVGRDPMREALGPGTQFGGVRGATLQAIAGRDLGCL